MGIAGIDLRIVSLLVNRYDYRHEVDLQQLSMAAMMSGEVSKLFRDMEAEAILLKRMEEAPASLWSVSEFVRVTPLSRSRVERAVTGLEAEGRIQGATVGRARVIQLIRMDPLPPSGSEGIGGDSSRQGQLRSRK